MPLEPRKLAVVVVASLSVWLTGCAARAGHDLSFAGGVGTQCTPVEVGSVMLAFDELGNPGSTPVTLDRVRLIGAHHVRLVGAFVAPTHQRGLLGVFPGWPPADVVDRNAFASRRPLHHYVVPPDEPHQRQVLLHLRVSRLNASFAAYRLYYRTSSGRERYMQTGFRMEFHGGPCA